MTVNEMQELMTKEEPLCDALLPYVSMGRLGQCVHHPLIIELFYTPGRCALVNEHYRYKRERVAEAEKEGNWNTYIALHERPYRFNALVRVLDRAGPEQYKLISWVWSDSENIFQSYGAWKRVLRKLPNPHKLMNEEESVEFERLPELITVHRGWHKPGTWRGLSWTTEHKMALWFAQRFADKSEQMVTTGVAKKSDVIAYFAGRGEDEIVVFPEKVERLPQ